MKVDTQFIDELIEKYYECETTLEEEKILQEYFTSDNVAAEHKYLIPQFIYYEKEKEQLFLNNFDEKMKQILDNTPQKKFTLKILTPWIYSAAAILIIALGINLILNKNKVIVTGNGDIDKNEFVFQKTIYAFELLSKNLDRTDDKLEHLNKVSYGLQQLNQLKQLENLKYINKLINNSESQ